ncbi:hypothetical protein AMAG_15058 [Allomyces macrogynus ATCC 38327]|uniref:UAS domain-containing protein n=1 Tax=Allomyces macrogynus (strain ATCC 38327) TaxID=578462 RepID=A0A0L0T5W9_ALLM3|nr:hypothetical protein AMAG_15058 [Allomyces macrogynus ATCC 38327]|eukprot:KNE70076.1 hypothetical protein AMAG_15058 [Allomyces macrogynus ATCC 38327]
MTVLWPHDHLENEENKFFAPGHTVEANTMKNDKEPQADANLEEGNNLSMEFPATEIQFPGSFPTSCSSTLSFQDSQQQASSSSSSTPLLPSFSSLPVSPQFIERPFGGRDYGALGEMYSPPVEILFTGTFSEAQRHAYRSHKWLLVDVYDPAANIESLRRSYDVWRNEVVKDMVQQSFVLIQMPISTNRAEKESVAVYEPSTGKCIAMIGGNPHAVAMRRPARLMNDPNDVAEFLLDVTTKYGEPKTTFMPPPEFLFRGTLSEGRHLAAVEHMWLMAEFYDPALVASRLESRAGNFWWEEAVCRAIRGKFVLIQVPISAGPEGEEHVAIYCPHLLDQNDTLIRGNMPCSVYKEPALTRPELFAKFVSTFFASHALPVASMRMSHSTSVWGTSTEGDDAVNSVAYQFALMASIQDSREALPSYVGALSSDMRVADTATSAEQKSQDLNVDEKLCSTIFEATISHPEQGRVGHSHVATTSTDSTKQENEPEEKA